MGQDIFIKIFMALLPVMLFCAAGLAQNIQKSGDMDERVVYEEKKVYANPQERLQEVQRQGSFTGKNSIELKEDQTTQQEQVSEEEMLAMLTQLLQNVTGGNIEELYKEIMPEMSGVQPEDNEGQPDDSGSFSEWGSSYKWKGLQKETR